MADQAIRQYKFGAELLVIAPERLTTTRQYVDLLLLPNVDAPVQMSKFGAEILAEAPPQLKVTRQYMDILLLPEGDSPVQMYKFGAEVLTVNPSELAITRQYMDLLIQPQGDTPLRIFKFGAEFICRAGPPLKEPQPLPSVWSIFAHNWSDVFKLSTAYDTNITRSAYSLTEDRVGLRQKPYRMATFQWSALKRSSLDRLNYFLRHASNERGFVPLVCDQVRLDQDVVGGSGQRQLSCNPTNRRFFANQRIAVVVYGEDMVVADVDIYEIEDITINYIETKTDIPSGTTYLANRTVVLPCMDTEVMMKPVISMTSGRTATARLTFKEAAESSALPPVFTGTPEDAPLYQGYPVFHFEPDWQNPPKVSYQREGEIKEQGRGLATFIEGDRYRLVQEFDLGLDRPDFFKFMRFFDSRRGRQQGFWMIDIEEAYEFLAISGVSNTFIDVVPEGDITEFEEDFDYVGIATKDGNFYVRETVTFQDAGTYFRITVTDALPELNVENVIRVTRARLSRFRSDEIEESWTTTEWVNIPVKIIELLDEQDVEMT